ncbi:hypothetical protein WJX72_007557 [[Myrmecia] bisecta]|uniref:Uncharacterized protein n=1 Tax=[Myrmecia] bisecta TaxID=41462 RepID=A0AAW1PYT0_9CHLO
MAKVLYQRTLQAINTNTWHQQDNRPPQWTTSAGLYGGKEPRIDLLDKGCAGRPDLQAHVMLSGMSSQARHDFDAVLRLEDMIRRGEQSLAALYSYHSCLRSPQVGLQDCCSPQGADNVQPASLQQLQANLATISDILHFCQDVAETLVLVCEGLVAPEAQTVHASTSLLRCMVRVIDLLHLMDTVRAAKPSVQADIKRTLQLLRLQQNSSDTPNKGPAGSQGLAEYLGRPWGSLLLLSQRLQKVPFGHRLMGLVVQHLHDVLVEKEFGFNSMLHPQRHSHLRALPAALALLFPGNTGGLGLEVVNVKVVQRCVKLLRHKPVAPGFADVPVILTSVLSLSIYIIALGQEGRAWQVTPAERLEEKQLANAASQYAIQGRVMLIRSMHDALAEQFAVFAIQADAHRLAGADLPSQVVQRALSLSQDILRNISHWTALLLELHAWRLAGLDQPANGGAGIRGIAASASGDLDEQAAAQRPPDLAWTSYSPEELSAMLEIIACTKGLAVLLARSASWSAGLVQQAVYGQVQHFLHVTVPAMVKPSMQRKVADALLSLQSACGPTAVPRSPAKLTHARSLFKSWRKRDPEAGQDPFQPQAEGGGSKIGNGQPASPMLRRAMTTSAALMQAPTLRAAPVPQPAAPIAVRRALPTRVQMHLILHTVECLLREGQGGAKRLGLIGQQDLTSAQLKALHEFHLQLLHWGPALELRNSIHQVTSLAGLWLRQCHTDNLQPDSFQITATLPYQMASLAIKSLVGGPMETCLLALEVFNDAGAFARQQLQEDALAETVRLEATLCLEALVPQLARAAFTHFKARAAALLADKAVLDSWQRGPAQWLPELGVPQRWDGLLRQSGQYLLGQSVNLAAMLGKQIQHLLRQNAVFLVDRFERFVNSLRLSSHARPDGHNLDGLRPVTDDKTAAESSRQAQQDQIGAQDVQRGAEPSCSCAAFLYGPEGSPDGPFGLWAAAHRGFFGSQHVDAFLKLTGAGGAALLIKHIQRRLQHILQRHLPAELADLLASLPPELLQDAGPSRRSLQMFSLLQHQMHQVAFARPDRQQAPHSLTELGNGLALLMLVESGLAAQASGAFMQAAPMLGLRPDPAAHGRLVRQAPGDPTPLPRALLGMDLAGVLHADDSVVSIAEALMQQAEAACWQATRSVTLLPRLLRNIQDAMHNNLALWDGPGVCFHHAWSALLLGLCAPSNLHAMPSWPEMDDTADPAASSLPALGVMDLGDGVLWGAAAIIYLLGQRAAWELSDGCTRLLQAATFEALAGQDPATAALRAFIPLASQATGTMQHAFRALASLLPRPPVPAAIGPKTHSAQLYYAPDPLPFPVPPAESDPVGTLAAPQHVTLGRGILTSHARQSSIAATALSTPQDRPEEPLAWERQSYDAEADAAEEEASPVSHASSAPRSSSTVRPRTAGGGYGSDSDVSTVASEH